MILRRRQIYWQPWNWSTRMWLVAIATSVLMSPIATRWFFLWQVPDVMLPFNVEDVIREDVPPEEDALVQYAAIAKRLSSACSDGRYADIRVRDLEWKPSDSILLTDMRDIIFAYQIAGTMKRGAGVSLKSIDPANTSPPYISDLRNLARFASAQAVLYERERDFENAWACHRALLQSSTHCESPGLVLLC